MFNNVKLLSKERLLKHSFKPMVVYLAGTTTLASIAQESSIEEIIVSTTGQSETLFSTPITVETVSGQQSQFDQATWIGETVNRMPGVYFQQFRGPVDAPAIRLPVSFDNVYLFLQDNVPLQSPISFNHAAFSYSGALTSPGGMEIIKGPGTAIHGSDALAAVVNVKSRAPEFDPSFNVAARAGEENMQDIRVDMTGGVNENHALRLAVSYQSDDGWRDTTAWDRTQIIGRHLYKNDSLEINSILSYTDFDSQMAGGLRANELATTPWLDGLSPQVDRDEARDQAEYLRLSSEIRAEVNDTLALQFTPYIRRIDPQYMAVWQPAITPITDSLTDTVGLLSRAYVDWSNRSSTIFGVDIENTDFERITTQTRPTESVFGTIYPQGVHLDYEIDYQSIAPFVEHHYQFNDQLSMVFGLRFEDSEYDFRNNLTAASFTAE
ncbi:MAG: TonB-dependent receptor, partial [Pseudomonadales bacterium]|nr:TonB-dependent receptor [Pseudomonadales bacterium]